MFDNKSMIFSTLLIASVLFWDRRRDHPTRQRNRHQASIYPDFGLPQCTKTPWSAAAVRRSGITRDSRSTRLGDYGRSPMTLLA